MTTTPLSINKLLRQGLAPLLILLCGLANAEQETHSTSPEKARAAWLDEAKYGLFIHWGLYSQMGMGEYIMHYKQIKVDDYAELAKTCNPEKFEAAQWAKIAKDAGMKYLVITGKHHDGFALYDSKVSDFNLVAATPFKRDLIAELKQACHEEGIKFGIYYSHAQDWYRKGGYSKYNWSEPSGEEDMQKYLEEVSLPQVREILTEYKPDILWLDTPRRFTPALAKPFTAAVREICPDTLINSRLIIDGNLTNKITPEELKTLNDLEVDYLSYGDREIPTSSPWPQWETCMTLNESWGYREHDHRWKDARRVLSQLLEVVSKGGAFLLNVGPTPEGDFPAESVQVLKEVGTWLQQYGDAVYSAEAVSFNLEGTPTLASLKRKEQREAQAAKENTPPPHTPLERDYPWIATKKGNIIYLSVFDWPTENTLTIDGVNHSIEKATLSGKNQQEISFQSENGSLTLSLPEKPETELLPVITLHCSAK